MEKRFAFTVSRIDRLKPAEKRYRVYDDIQQGLTLYVTPSGTKTFQFVKRSRKLNKVIYEVLGKYPALTIKKAREQAAALLVKVQDGEDIVQTKRDQKRKKLLDPTVEAFAAEYIEKYAKKNKKSWAEDQRIIDKDIVPVIGKIQMRDLKKRDIVAVLDQIEERGAMVACNRCHALLSKMLGFAVERDAIEISPMYGIKKRKKETPKQRVLKDHEIKEFWESLTNSPVDMLLKLMIVCGQRAGELRQMQFSEIDNEWVLTIPEEKSKNGLTHIVPLPEMGIKIIQEMKKQSPGPYVFSKNIKPFGKECLDKDAAPQRVRKLVMKLGWEKFTPHDLRRSFRTNLTKIGIRRSVGESLLNHKPPKIEGTYNLYEFLPEKKSALDRWTDHLNGIITGKTAASADNILNFPGKTVNE